MTQPDKRPSMKAVAMEEPAAGAQPTQGGGQAGPVQYTLVLHQVQRAIGEKRLTPAERAQYERAIRREDAQAAGRRAAPADVCDEYARCAAAYEGAASAGRIAGYGPLRMRYGVELALSIGAQLPSHDALASSAAEASAEAEVAFEASAPEHRKAVRALRTVLSGDEGALARLREANAGGAAKTGRARAIARLAAEVEYAREHVVASVLADAGLAPAVLDGLVQTAQSLAEARAARAKKHGARQAVRGALAEPAGRLLHELRLLLAGARAARRDDPTVPDVTSPLVSRRAPAAKPAPTPAPTPS